MSIALVIKTAKNLEYPYIPIAAESTFEEYWKPTIDALKLKWNPLFQSGLTIRNEEIPAILAEIIVLRKWMSDHYKEPEREGLLERVDRLTDKLKELQSDPTMKAFIG